MSIENNKEREWPPLANVFYEDEHMVSPRQLRKYGYRLKKGIKYRLYSLTELKEMIEDGRVVRVVPRPSRLTPKDGKDAG